MDDTNIPIYFDPQEIGRSLQEVSVEVVQTESQNVLSRWFHSTKDVDLYIWTDERNNIIKQQLSFLGQVVEWNILEGVKTGVVCEEEGELEGSGVKGSELIRFDETPQPTSIKMAEDLIRYVENLNEQDRSSILKNFSESPRMDKIDPEEFVRKYGRIQSGLRKPSLWAKLVRQIKEFF